MGHNKPFANINAYIWEETVAIIKARNIYRKAFANISDKNETTVIVELSKMEPDDIIEADDGWKIITFDIVLAFTVVGFLAKISAALADSGISIFAISAYSRDHILVKEENLNKAVKKLETLGFVFNEK